MIEMITR
jgi:hypothetical protein